MKKPIYILLLVAASQSQAGIQIVSDFDDTIKRSHIGTSKTEMVLAVGQYRKAYTAMPELYIEMVQNIEVTGGSAGIYVLSASPNVVRPAIISTLKSFNIPYKQVFTRNASDIGTDEKKIAYKIAKIESVLKANPKDQLILLGDNIEADQVIYSKVAKRNPGKVKEIYIRKVKNEDFPSGVHGFFSAFEIAANKYTEGRLSLMQVAVVASVIYKTKLENMRRVIPGYAHCPKDESEFNLTSSLELKPLEKEVVKKITGYCKIRKQLELEKEQSSKQYSY